MITERATRMALRRHLPLVRRKFALWKFTLPSEGSYHLFAGVDRADLLRGSNGELVALQSSANAMRRSILFSPNGNSYVLSAIIV